jgi:hypothetical protein
MLFGHGNLDAVVGIAVRGFMPHWLAIPSLRHFGVLPPLSSSPRLTRQGRVSGDIAIGMPGCIARQAGRRADVSSSQCCITRRRHPPCPAKRKSDSLWAIWPVTGAPISQYRSALRTSLINHCPRRRRYGAWRCRLGRRGTWHRRGAASRRCGRPTLPPGLRTLPR